MSLRECQKSVTKRKRGEEERRKEKEKETRSGDESGSSEGVFHKLRVALNGVAVRNGVFEVLITHGDQVGDWNEMKREAERTKRRFAISDGKKGKKGGQRVKLVLWLSRKVRKSRKGSFPEGIVPLVE